MMQRSQFTTTLTLILWMLLTIIPAYAQQYVVNLSATQTVPGAYGVGTVSFTKKDFLNGVGQSQNPKIDASALELVFDVGTKQFLVVHRADGNTISLVYTLTNDQALNFGSGDIVGSPSQVLRKADLLESGTTAPIGTITGLLRTGLDQSNVSEAFHDYYRWEATFQVLSQTGGTFIRYKDIISAGQQAPMILSGQLKVRNKEFRVSITQ